MRHGALYVHYFHYLSKQYTINRTAQRRGQSEGAARSRVKWKPFPVVPQCSDRPPFIELTPLGILGLVQISKMPAVQNSLASAGCGTEHTTIDWVQCSYEDARAKVTCHNVFEAFLSPTTYQKLLRSADGSKYSSKSFGNLISTDGQQAKLHYKATLRQQTASNATESEPKAKAKAKAKPKSGLDHISLEMFER